MSTTRTSFVTDIQQVWDARHGSWLPERAPEVASREAILGVFGDWPVLELPPHRSPATYSLLSPSRWNPEVCL